MMDCIHLHDIQLRCIIGTKPDERVYKQDVVLNIRLDCDLADAGRTDCLADAVHFRDLEKKICDLVEASRCELIERLAQLVADACLEDEKVRGVRVVLDKPRALRFARSAAVDIYRTRSDGSADRDAH